jgi:hypothetical protein
MKELRYFINLYKNLNINYDEIENIEIYFGKYEYTDKIFNDIRKRFKLEWQKK